MERLGLPLLQRKILSRPFPISWHYVGSNATKMAEDASPVPARIGRNRLARSIWRADPRFLVLFLFFVLFPRLMLSRRGNPLVGFGTNILANAFHDGDHGVVIPARAASNISINNVIAGQGDRACVQRPLAEGSLQRAPFSMNVPPVCVYAGHG